MKAVSHFIMDMMIIILVICIAACLLIGKIAYDKGKQIKVQEVNYNNQIKKYEYVKLCQDVEQKQALVDSLKIEYENKKALISDAKEYAQKAHDLQVEQLKKDYSQQKDNLLKLHAELNKSLQEEIEETRRELKKLSDTKAAAIKAFQQELYIKEQKDQYRLNITEAELEDEKILRAIQPRLSKPRILSMLIWQTYYQPLAKKKFALILGDNTVCGIYKITNIENEMCYIGQAKDVRVRFLDHIKSGLGIDTPVGNKLYQAMQEYGVSNFTFELLEECDKDFLNEKEEYYIELYNAVQYGYNGRKQGK